MFELFIILSLVAACSVAYIIRRFDDDPLSDFEPITEEELLILSVVDEAHYVDLLRYIRTMEMSPGLQVYLSNEKKALESISYYLMLRVLRQEDHKKREWERARISDTIAPKTHLDRGILAGIRRTAL